MKKGKFNFPGVDPEDLAQDIRVMCWQALEYKFDPSKVGKSVFHFVARVVDNGLYNKFRGVYLDNNPPCIRCEHYVKATKSCVIDEIGCDRITSYRNGMSRKRAIAAPASYDTHTDDNMSDLSHNSALSVGSTTGLVDLNDSLRSRLDDMLVPYYDLMVSGDSKNIPSHYRRMVQQQVKSILEEDNE